MISVYKPFEYVPTRQSILYYKKTLQIFPKGACFQKFPIFQTTFVSEISMNKLIIWIYLSKNQNTAITKQLLQV